MSSSNLDMYLGAWDGQTECFSLNTKFFGSFDVKLYLFGHTLPEENGSLPGLYDNFNTPEQNQTMLSIMQSRASIPDVNHDCASKEVLNKTRALLSLRDNSSTSSQTCHSSTVATRSGLTVSSECNQYLWSTYDHDNLNVHFCYYILNKYGPIQRAIRIFT